MLRVLVSAYILADSGFDVWMGNYRGNRFSDRHVNISRDDPQFWKFRLASVKDGFLYQTSHFCVCPRVTLIFPLSTRNTLLESIISSCQSPINRFPPPYTRVKTKNWTELESNPGLRAPLAAMAPWGS